MARLNIECKDCEHHECFDCPVEIRKTETLVIIPEIMLKCSECQFAEAWAKRFVGWGLSAGSNYVATVYECKHPDIKHTIGMHSMHFRGKTCPRNCPLKLKQ